ncbi:phosphoribosyltransferase family protein [Paenibacillus eucommiae]|uniref:Adenine/guanine phosphoribosyltransferase n=1 Tax=Paenibacillus eucommiae TaxID=1355755 RepID=A0ABS4J0X6_9BACL|nr:phosphoribosyltransferase family protein [Paenibacillus eucommiae]MBP1993489.1 hypothetical protein [Paenibacillus eucommiae]
MKDNILSPYYPSMSKRTYNILEQIQVQVSVTHNPYSIPLDRLFSMAARNNKKRAFLFVSHVLGKHIPVNPHVSLLSGVCLALLLKQEMDGDVPENLIAIAVEGLIDPSKAKVAYSEIIESGLSLSQPVTLIGFAETATAIGHAVYHTFQAWKETCSFIHTTREDIKQLESVISFNEEHSHAVAHYCYANDPKLLKDPETIVLVDDEITTGKTSLNIIREIQAAFPKKKYVVLSLLDWRTEEDEQKYQQLEMELGVTIRTIALVKGGIDVSGEPVLSTENEIRAMASSERSDSIEIMFVDRFFEHVPCSSQNDQGYENHSPYLKYSGRFGLDSHENQEVDKSIAEAAAYLLSTRIGNKTLCMGTGEFMYLPMRIAAEMGDGIYYQSTTRSPIHANRSEDYAVQTAYPYPSPDNPAVLNYLYNISPGMYDELYLFFEREAEPEAFRHFMQILDSLQLKKINIVFFSPSVQDWKGVQRNHG